MVLKTPLFLTGLRVQTDDEIAAAGIDSKTDADDYLAVNQQRPPEI